jgi:uncharacterized membrane protein
VEGKMSSIKCNEKGQASLVFVASMVIILAAFALVIDGGRFLVMRSRARMMADASAISGAGAIDVDEVQQGNFVLEPGGAEDVDSAIGKAVEVFKINKADAPEWTNYQIEAHVSGNQIWVTVTGQFSPVYGSGLGLTYSTSVTSSARAAVGISHER